MMKAVKAGAMGDSLEPQGQGVAELRLGRSSLRVGEGWGLATL